MTPAALHSRASANSAAKLASLSRRDCVSVARAEHVQQRLLDHVLANSGTR